jgi:hypothetical protein
MSEQRPAHAPAAPAPGDFVSWEGDTGNRLIGILVGFSSRGGKPVVRRWQTSKRRAGKPQSVDRIAPLPRNEWPF